MHHLYLFSQLAVSFNVIIIHSNSLSSFQPPCPDQERQALLQFKNSFHINCSLDSPNSHPDIMQYEKMKSWVGGQNVDCCSWDGVECNRKSGHVIGLDLTASCLYGTFPPNSTIFNLAFLTKLALSYNNFKYSRIPSELDKLSKLQVLRLFKSKFSGQIPAELSKLSDLAVLELGEDSMETRLLKLENPSLDKLIQNLTHLQELDLKNVDLSSTVPVNLQNLTTLKQISIDNCNLYGKLLPNLFHLPHLETLILTFNGDIGGLSKLQLLWLVSCSLTEFPVFLRDQQNLEHLRLEKNLIKGTIPQWFVNTSKESLLSFELAHNNLTGFEQPVTILPWTRLEVFDIEGNNFQGRTSYPTRVYKELRCWKL